MRTDLPPEPTGDEPLLPVDDSAYAPPAELDDAIGSDTPGGDRPALPRPGRRAGLRLGLVAGALVLGLAALLIYRSVHRARVLSEGTIKAEALLRLDTAAGYHEAAALLEPLAEVDPLGAASMRAFALAMLAADYRDGAAEQQAEALLVEPGRAERVPVYAELASAALFLGRRAVGDATTYATRARHSPWGGTLQGRLALLANNPEAGVEPVAAAAAADPQLASALAVQGDLLRRGRQDGPAAKAAYASALAASPVHPRATFGLAKLALSGDIPLADAVIPLRLLLAEPRATPAVERGRAALFLAAVQLRSGDRAGAAAALDGAGLDPAARTWAERAAAVLAARRQPYAAVLDAPPALQSASDDDPAELAPIPPAPPPPPAPPAPARTVARPVAKVAVKSASRPVAKVAAKAAAKTVAKKPVAAAAKKPGATKKAPAKRPAATR